MAIPLHVYLSTGYSPGWQGSRPLKQLDIALLHRKATEFLTNGLAPNTRTTYIAGQHGYLNFCQAIKTIPVPASERTLLLFATHLADSNITYITIKVYISAIRHMHMTEGLHEDFYIQLTPRLHLTLKGIKKVRQPPLLKGPVSLLL